MCNLISLSINIFKITDDRRSYVVNVGDVNTFPWCECTDWYENHMPCVHIFALMARLDLGEITWDILSPLYMQSVYCTIDGKEMLCLYICCATSEVSLFIRIKHIKFKYQTK